jgi:hypothetical protein
MVPPGAPLRPARVQLQVPVRYRIIGEDWREGHTRNISRTGVLIGADETPRLGAEADVVLTLPAGIFGDTAGEFLCTGAVIRLVTATAESGPGFAVMFRKFRLTVGKR